MNVVKIAKLGAFGIAAGAAGLSYSHQQHLYEANDLGAWSYIVPVMVDVLALLAAIVRGAENIPAALRKTATWTLAAAGVGSMAANVAVAENAVQVAVGIGAVVGYLLAENFVAALDRAAKAKAAADAAKRNVAMVAVAEAEAAKTAAVAAAEAQLRAALAAELASAVAEAERITRDAVMAQLATAPAARPATVKRAATVAKPMATGQAAAAVAAVLAATPDMDTNDVAKLTGASTRTVRRVRLEMRMAASPAA